MGSISFHTGVTVLMFTAFITLVIWVMSGKQKKTFDAASRIPLEDELDSGSSKLKTNGANNE